MVIEAMRERMGLGLVMGDHPSIDGEEQSARKKKHKC